MNKQDILDMPAGRELDALVAERVMRLRFEADKAQGTARWVGYGAYGEKHTPPMAWQKWGHKMPPYSSDISAAWEVVDAITNQGYSCVDIEAHHSITFCTVWDGDDHVLSEAKTAPEAICKAALLAVMDGET